MAFGWRSAAGLERIAIGGGQIPTVRHFRRLRFPIWIIGAGVHENPRFYKYYWRIWTRDDAIADTEMPEMKRHYGYYPWNYIVPALSFSTAINRMQTLCACDELFLVSEEKIKREDPEAPWDFDVIRARGGQLAPAYDDDADEPFFGHK